MHLWVFQLGVAHLTVLPHYLQLCHCSVGFDAAAVVQACDQLFAAFS